MASFMRRLIHDIRNDLNLLELESSILEDEIGKGRARVEDLAGTRDAMRRIEGALRKLSRRFQPLEPVMAASAATDLMENVQRLAEQGGQVRPTDEWQSASQELMVCADLDLLSEAILEVIENAVTRRWKDKPILVSVERDELSLRISIRESKAEAPDNFEEWGREPFDTNDRLSYGLGLNHAARIVAAHNGRITRSFHSDRHCFDTSILVPLLDGGKTS